MALFRCFLAAAFAVGAASTESQSLDALVADDECGESDSACALNALQILAKEEESKSDDLIRAYAAERGRPPLTEIEVKAIRGLMDQTSPQRANMPLAKLRALEDDEELSEACANAVEEDLKEVRNYVAKLSVDYEIECWWYGYESDGCLKTMKKIEDFNKTIIEQCKEEGDLCTITQTHESKDGSSKTESESVCIPKECHDELGAATQATAKKIQEKEAAIAQHSQGLQHNQGLSSHDVGDDDVVITC